MIQRKLSILSQAGLAVEDFSGATNTVIKVGGEGDDHIMVPRLDNKFDDQCHELHI